jgi:L-iditol 2-dehydrogenase
MQGLNAVRQKGTVMFFGGTWPEVKLEIDPNLFHYNEIKLTGASNFNYGVFPRALKLMSSKLIKLESLISHRLPLDRIREGFDLVEKREGMKIIMLPQM